MKTKLRSAAQRQERIEAKRRLILRWLREEIYTTREVAQTLLGLTPSPTKITLANMRRDGLLHMEQVICPSGWKPVLYGITAHGQGMAFDPGELPSDRTFEPGRVGLTVLQHTITLQLARLRAERAGWRDWQVCDRLGKWVADQGRPDAIATDPQGTVWAIELELTMKTTKRYESVIFERLRQIRAGMYARVVWLSPTQAQSDRLGSIIKGIREFTREVNGSKQHVLIDPETHHPKLAFVSLDQWPNIPHHNGA